MFKIGVSLLILGTGKNKNYLIKYCLILYNAIYLYIIGTKAMLNTYKKIKNKEFFNPAS